MSARPVVRCRVPGPSLELWFEFASTYSYPAVERIESLAAPHGVTVEWRPFLLGPIFRAQGWNDSPFNIYPVKGRYMWRDLERLTAKYGLPFRHPTTFPRSGLLAARIACIATSQPWCAAFIRRVYRANFAEDRDIATPEVLRDILTDLGQSAPDILTRANADDTKRQLRDQTDRAITLGIFGAPTCVVGPELFWGHDRLEDAITWASTHADDVAAGRSHG
jgi:2-hydroxychromene-2-carboxylate isomerase